MGPVSKSSKILVTSLRMAALGVVLFVLFSTIYAVVGVANDPSLMPAASNADSVSEVAVGEPEAGSARSQPISPAEQGRLAMILLGVCFLQALVVSVAILRSQQTGWRLMLTLFIVLFLGWGIVSHIDSLFFLHTMSRALIGKMVLASLLLAATFSPIAVWMLGRARRDRSQTLSWLLGHPSKGRWVTVFAVLTVLHIALYFVFGYYVAWQSPELRAYYGGEDPGSFWLQMVSVAQGTPWLIPVQVLRGLLWGLMAVLLAGILGGPRWTAGLITGALFVVVFALPLVIPNPLMPDAVRYAHLAETVLSRGLFGFLAVWWLRGVSVTGSAHPELVERPQGV